MPNINLQKSAPSALGDANNSLSHCRPKFWQLPLHLLNLHEWEALCDGCGLCCLIKYIDDDTDKVEYTDVACKLLDINTGLCSNYPKRQKHVPDCITLEYGMLKHMQWLPNTCAYKRLFLGNNLPHWHYLIAGHDVHQMFIKKIGAQKRCVSEQGLSDEAIEVRVVRWVDCA